jgi:drug/metabolite transporter (DMT)-like permease
VLSRLRTAVVSRGLGRMQSRAGLLAVSLGALLWGTAGVGVSIVGQRTGLDAVPIGCLRLAVAGVTVFAFAGRRGWTSAWTALRTDPWVLVGSGIGLGFYQAMYFIGVQDVGVSVSTLISLAVAPVALTIVAALGRRRLPGLLQSATVVAAVGGLALISLKPGAAVAPHPTIGLIASFLSGLGYAGTTLLNRRLVRTSDPLILTGASSAIGALVLVPFAIPFGLYWPSDALSGVWLVYIGVVTTVAAYGLFFTGLRTVAPETAGVLTLLEPLAAAVIAALVLHESLSGLGVAGAVLILLAIGGLYLRTPEVDAHDLAPPADDADDPAGVIASEEPVPEQTG